MPHRVRDPYVTEEFRSDICNQLLDYWRQKCRGDACPFLKDIELMDLYRIAPHILVADAIDDGTEYIARFFGTGIVKVFGFDRTYRKISERFPPERVPMIIERYALSRRTGKPVRVVGYLTAVSKDYPFAFEAIYLPLRDRDGDIEHIISAYDFNYEPAAEDDIAY